MHLADLSSSLGELPVDGISSITVVAIVLNAWVGIGLLFWPRSKITQITGIVLCSTLFLYRLIRHSSETCGCFGKVSVDATLVNWFLGTSFCIMLVQVLLRHTKNALMPRLSFSRWATSTLIVLILAAVIWQGGRLVGDSELVVSAMKRSRGAQKIAVIDNRSNVLVSVVGLVAGCGSKHSLKLPVDLKPGQKLSIVLPLGKQESICVFSVSQGVFRRNCAVAIA